MGDVGIVILIVVFFFGILITRWLGAWMFRINEVIDSLEEIRKELSYARMERQKEKDIKKPDTSAGLPP